MSLWQRLVGRRRIVTRLVLAVAVAMFVVLLVAGAFVYWRVSFALDRQVDQDLDAWANVVVPSVRAGETPPSDTPGQTFQVYDASGRLLAGDQTSLRLADRERVRSTTTEPSTYDLGSFIPAADRSYRVHAVRISTPDGPRVVAAAISRRKHDEALRELLLQLAIADLLALAAASFVGYRAARAALDPVEAYRRAAAQAGVEEADRLPVAEDRDDELTRLGHTFNDLLDRIEASAVRERRFLADASHELRTPLALMNAELEWAGRTTRSPEELTEVLQSMRSQLQRLVVLSNALLELEELRAGGSLDRQDVSLREIVEDARRDAVAPDTEVRVSVPDEVMHVNGRWLTVAVANLLRNADRHGAGPISVEATYDEPWLRVVVRDSGPGFPEAFRADAFDRFSRAEESRTTQGSGLGLSLVRQVAVAHGGTARILEGPGAAVELVVSTRD